MAEQGQDDRQQSQQPMSRPLRGFDAVVWNNEPASTTDRQPELSEGAKAYDAARAKLGDSGRRLHSFDDLIWKK